jgi:hypothetical protein
VAERSADRVEGPTTKKGGNEAVVAAEGEVEGGSRVAAAAHASALLALVMMTPSYPSPPLRSTSANRSRLENEVERTGREWIDEDSKREGEKEVAMRETRSKVGKRLFTRLAS